MTTFLSPPRRLQPSPTVCFTLAAICLIGWFAFTIHLGYESMWSDEYTSWNTTNNGPLVLIQITAADVHPPLYYFWLWGWRLWTGSDNLYIMRLSSAIMALLAIALCYRVGRDWFNDRWIGIGAAAFLTTSGVFIYYARDLRMYPLVVVLTLLSWWSLWRLINQKRSGLWGYALCVIAMEYTYYYLAFIVLVQLIVVLLFYRSQVRRLIGADLVAAIVFIPWLPTLVAQMSTVKQQSGGSAGPLIGKFLGTVSTNAQSLTDLLTIYTAKQPIFIIFLLIIGLGTMLTLPRLQRPWLWAAALWLFLTLFLFFTINLVFPIYGLRYVFFVIPAIALLIGLAITQLSGRWLRIIAIVTLLMAGLATHIDGFQLPHIPHRDLLATINSHFLPGDRIWFELSAGALGSSLDGPDTYYMAHEDSKISPSIFVWNAPDDYKDLKLVPRVWVVKPYWITPPAQTIALLITGRTITEQTQFDAYTVTLYEAPPNQHPVMFSDLFALKISPLDKTMYQPGETVTLTTWWQTLQSFPRNYSLGLYLTQPNSTNVIAQADQGLLIDGKPTSQIAPSPLFALASPTFSLPSDLQPGPYDIWGAVYFYLNPTRLSISGESNYLINPAFSMIRLGRIQVDQ